MSGIVHPDLLPDGALTHRVRLTAADGAALEVSSLGASVTRLIAGDRNGDMQDIVLSLPSAPDYWRSTSYFGASVGRFANRIGGARFVLGQRACRLDANEGANTLHGGRMGFHRAIWKIAGHDDASVRFEHTSRDGDMGFPGAVHVYATYTLLRGGGFAIAYEATADEETIVSLANHAYFNLAGEGRGTILDHEVSIAAEHYLPVRADLVPTGDIAPVAGTPFDLRTARRLGDSLAQDHPQLELAGGFDHNFCLRGRAGVMRDAAVIREPGSGRVLTVRTDAPGLQFYTGQQLTGEEGRDGRAHVRFGGFCVEAQAYPDAPNKPQFPSAVLGAGARYASHTQYALSLSA